MRSAPTSVPRSIAADRTAGGGLRRRDLLRHVLPPTAPRHRPERLHRPRVHGGRGVAAVRRGRGAARPRQRRAGRTQSLPRPVRAGPGGARDQGGRSGAYGGVGAGDRAGGGPRRERAGLGGPGAAGRDGRTAGRAGPSGPAQARRRGRPVLAGRLPGGRRLHRAAPGLRARSRRSHPRGHRLRPGRTRWRRLPHRPHMAGHGVPARPPPLPGVQRRRVRARHLQGPRDHGGRPVRAGRGDDRRGVRHRRAPGVRLSARRVTRGHCGACGTPSSRHARVASSARTSSARDTPSTSRSGAVRAPTSAARRRPCSTPSRATGASRAPSRRSPWRRDCSGSRRSRTTWRR